jgi:glycosyltransferase involved in cell wall biosynthesis
MKFSIIVPTRKRPVAVCELVESIVNTSDNFDLVEILFYIDKDDIESENCILSLQEKYGDNIKYTSSREDINLSQMWNYVYDTISTGDIIMLCADDIRFRTNSWDTLVRNEFLKVEDKIILVYGDDKIHSINHATHSFVHRKWIETSGFWLPPYFCHDYVDTWLFEVSNRLVRSVYLPSVVTDHMHYSFGKSAYDSTAEKKLLNASIMNPALIYEQKSNERDEQTAKLQQYIDQYTAAQS